MSKNLQIGKTDEEYLMDGVQGPHSLDFGNLNFISEQF